MKTETTSDNVFQIYLINKKASKKNRITETQYDFIIRLISEDKIKSSDEFDYNYAFKCFWKSTASKIISSAIKNEMPELIFLD